MSESDGLRKRAGFGSGLIVAIAAVVIVGLLTSWAVASAVGPSIFRDHLAQSGESDPHVISHADMAFKTAGTLSVVIAGAAALAASIFVGVLISRRLSRSLGAASEVAQRVSAGDYEERMENPLMGREFTALSEAVNSMAGELASVEASRRSALGDLGHEMRTPIAAIRGYLEAVDDGVRELDSATMDVLLRNVARLERLSVDIADVTEAEEGRLAMVMDRVDLPALLRGAVADAQSASQRGQISVELEISPQAEEARVNADSARLAQVFSNLFENGLGHARSKIVVDLVTVGSQAIVTVSDDGEGIPPEHVGHVFERFYRVDSARDRERGGSGIGLAVVKALVEAHGGRVSAVSSGKGEGATFVVTLPLA